MLEPLFNKVAALSQQTPIEVFSSEFIEISKVASEQLLLKFIEYLFSESFFLPLDKSVLANTIPRILQLFA